MKQKSRERWLKDGDKILNFSTAWQTIEEGLIMLRTCAWMVRSCLIMRL